MTVTFYFAAFSLAATAALRHPLTVFLMSMAMVMGPTPPGTCRERKERRYVLLDIAASQYYDYITGFNMCHRAGSVRNGCILCYRGTIRFCEFR